MRPFSFLCLAATLVLLCETQLIMTAFVGRHTIAHQHWNRQLLAGLVCVVLLFEAWRHAWQRPTVSGAGIALAALGLAARALIELALGAVDRWWSIVQAAASPVDDTIVMTRWLGLAAYAVGMTLFAVEVAGWWIDRKVART